MQTISGWWPLRGRSQECCLSIYPVNVKKMKDSFIFKMRKPNYERTPKKDLSHSHYRLDQRNGLWKMKLWWLSLFPWARQIASSSRLFFLWCFSWSMWPLFWETSGWSLLIWMDSRLHSPVNFFLSPLSFVDVYSSSVIGPKMLTDIFVEKKVISFFDCAARSLFIFGQCVVIEYFLLTSVAYDWHMAICKPYFTHSLYLSESVGSWWKLLLSKGASHLDPHNFHLCLPYCGPKIISPFFCDLLPVSPWHVQTHTGPWSFTFPLGAQEYSVAGSPWPPTFSCCHCPEDQSADRRWKAFSTCSSHLTAVSNLYGVLFFIYVRPSSSFSLDSNKVVFVFYTAWSPCWTHLSTAWETGK